MKNIVDHVRRPEYTGRQRCWPCTVVNAALLAVGCGVLALAGLWPAVLLLGAVGAAAIWLRGYLVPYTPQFAPRLAGALPGDPFHVADGGRPGDGEVHSLAAGSEVDGERLMETLLETGVLVVGPDGDDLRLSDETREAWDRSMASLRDLEPAELAARLRVLSGAPDVETTTQETGVWYLLHGESGAVEDEVFLSRPVAIAEIGALDVLDDYVEDAAVRRQAVEPLRMFLDSCPACEVDLIETDTLDCCGGKLDKHTEPAPVLACPECSRRLYTFPT